MSDPDFMKQLARLKEEHMANLRVIERMYNEGQQAAGTLPMDDFAAASYVLPADSLSYSGERYEPPERSSTAAGGSGASRPNFSRPLLDAPERDPLPPPPPPPPPPAARPASAGPGTCRSARAPAATLAAADVAASVAAAEAASGVPGLGLAASSSVDNLDALRRSAPQPR